MEESKQSKKVIQEVDPYAIKKAREEAEPFAPSKELQIEKKKSSSGKRALEIEKRESLNSIKVIGISVYSILPLD